MNTLISRYWGKIKAVAKGEGFLGLAKKSLLATWKILKPVKAGNVLFISSGIVGDSFRYRVQNVCEELELHGLKCSSVVQEYPFLSSCADKFDVFIFHKVAYIPQIQKFVEELKKKNKEIIFETDDLLFDVDLVKQQDFFKNSNEEMQKFHEKGVGAEFVDDPYVKTCTISTTFLAKKLREKGKQVFVVPNRLSKKDIEIASKILKANEANAANEAIKLGYFSGTHSHNKDFATITNALQKIMEKYANVELFLVGPLDTENELNKFGDRIKKFPYAVREKHFENVASVDINISPLEIENPFCQARSELKFFEAAIVKVPTVAVATQTFCEAIEDGIDGFLANEDKEWFEKLEKLIIDADLRKKMGEKAYQKAMEKYSIEKSDNKEYYEYLKSKIYSVK